MPNYFKIGQGNQWLRPASATCDFRISHGTANSARCTLPTALPWYFLVFIIKHQCRYIITILCSQTNAQIKIQNVLQILLTFTVEIHIRHMSNVYSIEI